MTAPDPSLLDRLDCQTAVDLAGLGVWTVDLQASTVALSEAAGRLYGKPALRLLPIAEWRQSVADDDRSRILAAFDATGPAGDEGHRFQFRSEPGQEIHLQERWRVVRSENGRPVELLGVVSDVSQDVAHERRRHELIHELQHRMKNMLAVVRSIARRTAAHSRTVEDFSAHFEGRLAALANVQATLARTPDGRADLEDIIRQELVHSFGSDEGIAVSGPTMALRGRMVELIALAVHELAANAVKFGSVEGHDGLSIVWDARPAAQADERVLVLDWIEAGGGPLAPDRTGFGLELVQRGLPYELDAQVDVDFSGQGLRCRIEIPLGAGGG